MWVDRAAILELDRRAAQAAVRDCGSGRSMRRLSDAVPGGLEEFLARVKARREAIPAEEREQRFREVEAADARAQERVRLERAQKLLKESGVPEREWGRILENFRPFPHQVEPLEVLRELLLEFRAGKRDWWVVLQGRRGADETNPGANGIGKSALAMAATVGLCRRGFRGQFWTEARLIRALFSRMRRYGEGGLEEFVSELCDLPWLVLDNLGTDNDFAGGFVRQCLFDVLDSRMNDARPLLITTNLGPDEFEARYGHDLYSRVSGMTGRRDAWIAFSGPDLRKRALERVPC